MSFWLEFAKGSNVTVVEGGVRTGKVYSDATLPLLFFIGEGLTAEGNYVIVGKTFKSLHEELIRPAVEIIDSGALEVKKHSITYMGRRIHIVTPSNDGCQIRGLGIEKAFFYKPEEIPETFIRNVQFRTMKGV